MTTRVLEVRRPRSDALPEGFDYPDTGCGLHPSCLTCPLPSCRYDNPRHLRREAQTALAMHAVLLHAQGLPWAQVASTLGLRLRRLYRYLALLRRP